MPLVYTGNKGSKGSFQKQQALTQAATSGQDSVLTIPVDLLAFPLSDIIPEQQKALWLLQLQEPESLNFGALAEPVTPPAPVLSPLTPLPGGDRLTETATS